MIVWKLLKLLTVFVVLIESLSEAWKNQRRKISTNQNGLKLKDFN
jgi:hypothetical protein